MRFLIVVLFMVLASSVSGQEAQGVAVESPGQQEGERGQAGGGAGQTEPLSVPVRIVEEPNEAQRARDRDDARYQREADDLKAQEKAADAAFESAASSQRQENLARWQLGLSIAGIIALIVTIAYSIKATNAAVAANGISKELFAAENRPWLRLGRPVIRINEVGDDIFFEIKAVNIGKTPALSAEVHTSVTRTRIPVASVAAVENFASKFTVASAWKNNHKVIFPERHRLLRPMDGGDVDGNSSDFVRIVYCVTYRASGLDRTLRTGGEVLFNPAYVDIGDNIDGDWFLVEKFHSYGVAVAD